jgi:FkbM family methyltransferase
VLTRRLRAIAKSIVPPRARYWMHVALCWLTSLTIRDRARVREARRLGSRPCRVLAGDLRGTIFFNPVGQTSPAYVLGHFEDHVAHAMQSNVRSGDVVYDVGANAGWHTLRLAHLVGPEGVVHSFEPTPRDQSLLALNLVVNGISTVVIEPVALSDVEGTVPFATFTSPGVNRIAGTDLPADAMVIDVEATMLDTFVFDRGHDPPTFIKIDVEGGELSVLQGARRVIVEHRPIVVAEVRRDRTWDAVNGFFSEHRYDSTVLWGDEFLADVLFTPTQ